MDNRQATRSLCLVAKAVGSGRKLTLPPSSYVVLSKSLNLPERNPSVCESGIIAKPLREVTVWIERDKSIEWPSQCRAYA